VNTSSDTGASALGSICWRLGRLSLQIRCVQYYASEKSLPGYMVRVGGISFLSENKLKL
jgi:hypothetical protein